MQTYYETDRLILKVLLPDACHSVLHFYSKNREHFQPYDPAYPDKYFTTDYQRSALVYELNQFRHSNLVRYYLFLKDNPGTIIGTISFTNIQYGILQSCVAGYKLDIDKQKNGYAYEALSKGISVMFEEYGLHRIESYIMQNNLRSIHLCKKLGFEYEGTCREHALIMNQWTDHDCYARINRVD